MAPFRLHPDVLAKHGPVGWRLAVGVRRTHLADIDVAVAVDRDAVRCEVDLVSVAGELRLDASTRAPDREAGSLRGPVGLVREEEDASQLRDVGAPLAVEGGVVRP